MKILAVCGHGLGSSFMLERNIKNALKTLNKEAEVDHVDVASVTDKSADLFIVGKDLEPSLRSKVSGDKVIALSTIVGSASKKELEEKLSSFFK